MFDMIEMHQNQVLLVDYTSHRKLTVDMFQVISLIIMTIVAVQFQMGVNPDSNSVLCLKKYKVMHPSQAQPLIAFED